MLTRRKFIELWVGLFGVYATGLKRCPPTTPLPAPYKVRIVCAKEYIANESYCQIWYWAVPLDKVDIEVVHHQIDSARVVRGLRNFGEIVEVMKWPSLKNAMIITDIERDIEC
jgi:hypothetical protein